MTDAAISVRDLVVDRGGRRVLHGLNLSVRPGTVTGLLGPSGSGKTTLMRCMVGVQRVTAGSVTLFGLPAGTAELRSRIGYVTQAPSVYGDLSVHDNVRYFASLRGLGPPAVDQVIGEVDLGAHTDDLVGALSGGERARTSLACALLGPPELLVLDEPTVGLDPVLRRDLWMMFHRLAGAGTTILVSSHVMDEAARCQRLLLLREGRLVADDEPDQIRRDTGTDDIGEAFLRLIERGQTQTSPARSDSRPPAAKRGRT